MRHEAAPDYSQVLIEGSWAEVPQDRGREAEAPWQISARGWADILRRAWKDTSKRNLSLVAGGVTYYLLLALFPALAALVSRLRSGREPSGRGEKRPVAVGYASAIDRGS